MKIWEKGLFEENVEAWQARPIWLNLAIRSIQPFFRMFNLYSAPLKRLSCKFAKICS
jgi:hypothetical protein